MKHTIPVYLINGFLESGKTEFIKYTISQPYFKTSGTTLLIVCEEGELEYEDKLLKATKTKKVDITEESEFNPEGLAALEKQNKPERIIIEYNGMWNPENMNLPENWSVEQQITTINASTFPMYYTNMKSLVAEHVRQSELIIFNRCDDISQLQGYKRNIKAINAKADIVFEDEEGEINISLEEDLPYNLEDGVIVLDDRGYAVFYLDALENKERYHGKTIEFIGRVLRTRYMDQETFVPGRMAMTCCADDMTFIGFVCKWKEGSKLKAKDWIRLRAKISVEEAEEYDGSGPVLYAENVELIKAPKDEIIDFSNI